MNYDYKKFELSYFSKQGRIHDYPYCIAVGKVKRAFRQGQLPFTLKLRNAKLIEPLYVLTCQPTDKSTNK